MEVVNATGMTVGYTQGFEPSGRELLVVVVKGTFAIPGPFDDADAPAQPHPVQRPLIVADTFTGEPGYSAPAEEVDFAPRKHRCDVLVSGVAHAPHGEPKIVSCPRGRIWDVAVDLRDASPTYRQWQAFELSPDSDSALHLPSGVAHGFVTLEPDSEVHYLMGAAYVPGAATGVRWDDPAIGIDWSVQPAVISDADRGYALLEPTV